MSNLWYILNKSEHQQRLNQQIQLQLRQQLELPPGMSSDRYQYPPSNGQPAQSPTAGPVPSRDILPFGAQYPPQQLQQQQQMPQQHPQHPQQPHPDTPFDPNAPVPHGESHNNIEWKYHTHRPEADGDSLGRKAGKRKLVIPRDLLKMKQMNAALKIGIPPSTFSKRWRESLPDRTWPYRNHRRIEKNIKMLKAMQQKGHDVTEELGRMQQQQEENLSPAVIDVYEDVNEEYLMKVDEKKWPPAASASGRLPGPPTPHHHPYAQPQLPPGAQPPQPQLQISAIPHSQLPPHIALQQQQQQQQQLPHSPSSQAKLVPPQQAQAQPPLQVQPSAIQVQPSPMQPSPNQAPSIQAPIQVPVQTSPIQAPIQNPSIQAPSAQASPIQNLQSPPVVPVHTSPVPVPIQTSPVQTSPLPTSMQTPPIHPTTIHTSPIQASPIQTSIQATATPLQTAHIQTSPLQAAPIQTSPLQAAPIQTSPIQPPPQTSSLQSPPSQLLSPAQAIQVSQSLQLQSQLIPPPHAPVQVSPSAQPSTTITPTPTPTLTPTPSSSIATTQSQPEQQLKTEQLPQVTAHPSPLPPTAHTSPLPPTASTPSQSSPHLPVPSQPPQQQQQQQQDLPQSQQPPVPLSTPPPT